VAGPAAEEIGLTLQDSIKVYRAKRQYRLFEKMRDFVREAGYEPRHIPLKILLPSMDYASVEEDEGLHTAWATLLANAADPNIESISAAFPEILRQMSPHEARLLSQASRYPLRWH
jgi:Abortive infection alpha